MTPAWAPRREACVSDGRVSPDVFTSMVERLGHCVGSSQRALETEARHRHVHRSLQGLRSHGPGKPAEDSAPVGDVERPGRQAGVGTAPWDHQPVSEVLGGQGAVRLGDPKGGSALAPRSLPKRGPPAVGGHRPWWRHRGQGDHCQGGVCMSSVSRLARLAVGPACGVGAGRTTPPGRPGPRGGAVSHAARAVPGEAGRLGAAGAAGLGDRR